MLSDSSSEVANDTAPTASVEALDLIKVPRYSYYALGVLSLVNFLNYIDRQILPAVAPLMLRDPELKLTDAELGYIEAALLLSFTVLAPLFGRLGDRRARAKLMALAAVIWSFATALTGVVDRLPFVPDQFALNLPFFRYTIMLSGAALALCFVRAAVGIGESAYSTITPSLIADYFPPARRATALGVFQAAIPMGFALGFVVGGILAHFFGWRMAFTIVGVPGILTAILVWRLREPVRGSNDPIVHHSTHSNPPDDESLNPLHSTVTTSESILHQSIRSTSVWRTAWSIITTRDWLLSTIGYTALTSALGAFATWATVLLVRDKGMTETNAAVTLGVVTLLAGAAGTFGGGWLSDRIRIKRFNRYFLVCGVSTLLGIGPTLLALTANDPRLYLPAVAFAVMLLFVSNAPFHAILISSVPASVRALSVALNIVAIHTFGDAISRAAVGVLSEQLKIGNLSALADLANLFGIDAARQHLSAAMLIAPAALVVSTIFFLWGARKPLL